MTTIPCMVCSGQGTVQEGSCSTCAGAGEVTAEFGMTGGHMIAMFQMVVDIKEVVDAIAVQVQALYDDLNP